MRVEKPQDMPVYRAAYELGLAVERETRRLGPDFRWLRQQVLRSSESVVANLSEGFYGQYSSEYLQSLYRCRREAAETLTHLEYARDTGCLPPGCADALIKACEDTISQLLCLILAIERKIRDHGKVKPAVSETHGEVKPAVSEAHVTNMIYDPQGRSFPHLP